MQDYNICKLSDVIDFNPKEKLSKGSLAKKVSMDKLQPYTKVVSSFDIAKYNGGAKFRNGDTIMARITPCLENGKTSFVDFLDDKEVAFGSTEFIVMRAKEGITDSQYIYYLATSPEFRKVAIQSMVGSSGRQRVQQGVLNEYEIALPPLEEQKRIAAILSALDDKIEINRKINDNLEQQAQALFKSWFIDFEPFSADGTMPSEWRIGSVGEIIELHDSKRIPLSGAQRAKMDKIYPYYGATSLMDYVDDYIFDGIYLLLGEDGTVVDDRGFPILQYINGKFWVNNHAHILTGKLGFSVEELYLFFSLTNIKSIVTGAVQQKVSQGNLKSIPATIPPESVLRDFDNLIQPLFSEIRNLRDECANLSSLRDTLLPKLMSGELDVSDIDI